MFRLIAILSVIVALAGCDKHDPILPGTRTAIFDSVQISVTGQDITDAPSAAFVYDNASCPYTQDSTNVIWDGPRKVFSGFATSNTVKSQVRPVCSGKYLYAGLSTGELIKINPKNRQIIWIADIYRASNLTGGASMVDIIAPIIPCGDSVYVGGLGDAFCRVNATSGVKKWCLDIGVSVPFVLAGNYAFVVGTDKNLYAISVKNGDVYWRAPVSAEVAPEYLGDAIRVGADVFNVSNGKKVLDK